MKNIMPELKNWIQVFNMRLHEAEGMTGELENKSLEIIQIGEQKGGRAK